MAGYCTPNGEIDQCEVAESSDKDVAASLPYGAIQSVGYDLCSAGAVNSNYYCSANDSEGVLDAVAFPSPSDASGFLTSVKDQQWLTGWQLNNWAIVVGSAGSDLPSGELDKIEKSLASAAVINNGEPSDDGPVLMNLVMSF